MRTVVIGDKKVVFETGHTPDDKFVPKGRPKTSFRLALEAMQPGESFVAPFDAAKMKDKSVTMCNTAKATGRTFAYRKTDGGYRIFRTDDPVVEPIARKTLLQLASGW